MFSKKARPNVEKLFEDGTINYRVKKYLYSLPVTVCNSVVSEICDGSGDGDDWGEGWKFDGARAEVLPFCCGFGVIESSGIYTNCAHLSVCCELQEWAPAAILATVNQRQHAELRALRAAGFKTLVPWKINGNSGRKVMMLIKDLTKYR